MKPIKVICKCREDIECNHYLHSNPEFTCPKCQHNCYPYAVKEVGDDKFCAICGFNLKR